MSSYSQKAIDLTFTKQDGNFTEGGANTVTVSGLRASVTITAVGAPTMNQLTAHVFGLTPSMMNDLAILGMLIMQNTNNKVSVYAGDAGSKLPLVFVGTIFHAWIDFASIPNVSLEIQAQTGLAEALTSISPLSVEGSGDVVSMISGLAHQMGRSFENDGVSGVRLSNPYYGGDLLHQVRDIAMDANINYHDDGVTLAIWPAGAARNGVIPLISPETGMVGYPKLTALGLDVVTAFNSNLRLGGQVRVQSIVPQACGIWDIYGMVHNIESQTPGGSWFSAVRLVTPGYFAGRTIGV